MPEQLKLEVELVYKMFEQNCTKGDTLLGMIASGLLADMIAINAQTSNFIVTKITGSGLALLVHLIDAN